jgi:hypothetical protein
MFLGRYPHYILVTCKNVWSKYGDFNFIYLFSYLSQSGEILFEILQQKKANDSW